MGKKENGNYLKKELYELIKTDESIFDFIQESSLDGLWYWDLEHPENEWMNAKFWTVLGYDPDEMPHKSGAWQNIINQDDLKTALANFTKHCEDPKHPYDQIVRYTHKDGSTIWVRCRGMAIRDSSGKPLRMLGAHHDVTKAMVSLDLNRAMAEMLNVAPSSITVHDMDGNFLYANQKTYEIHGYQPGEFLKLNLHELDAPASEALIAERMNLIEKNGYASFEVEHYRKDGSVFPLEVYAKKVMWQEKPALLSIATDITARKRAEQEHLKANEKILESEQKYKEKHELLSLFIKYSPIYAFIKSIEPNSSRVLYASDNYVDMIGISGAEMIGKNMFELFPAEFAKKITEDDINVTNKGEILKLNEDLGGRNYTTIKFPIIQENTSLLAGYTIDITDLKHTERELQNAKEKAEESERQFSELFENMEQGFALHEMIYDGSGTPVDYRFILINKSFERLTGLSANECIGKTVKTILPNVENYWIETYGNVAKTRTPVRYENYIEALNRYYDVVAYSPKENFFAVVFTDVTKNKLYEHELVKAKEKAEESDRLKTAFLQNMSHEIRTPMNAIMGFSSLLASNFNNKEKLEHFSQIIENRCNDLLDIINDVLDISKIESGQSTLNIEHCNIHELFDELALFFQDYEARINKQHIDLRFIPFHDHNVSDIKTDKLKLKQILINLVSNSVKFTETGSIVCGYQLKKDKIQFYVRDTGVGIPADKHAFIFERFTQLNHPKSQNAGGTGLGLPIVKGLVRLLGGNVWLESEYNKGTTFYFSIDYVPAEPLHESHSAPAGEQEIIRGRTILIVEDDSFNAEYLKEVLKNVVSDIRLVSDGMSAVKAVQEQKIDLVLMDIRLPDISGYEASRMILNDHPDLKIIAQTAYAAHTERQIAIDSGCVDYINKPVKQEQLLSLVRKHLK